MTFPSVDSAVEYVRGKLADFFMQKKELQSRLKTIFDLRQLAEQSNDQNSLARLAALRADVVQLLDDQLRLEDLIRPYAVEFGVMPSLGVLPIALTVGAAAVASMLYLHYERLQRQKEALALVAKGMLSASEADAIVNPGLMKTLVGGGGGSVWLLMALAGAGYVYFLSKARG